VVWLVLVFAITWAAAAQAPPAPSAAPFTDLESARLDAIAQEGRALDAEQRLLTVMREKWQAKVTAFKAAAERDRPGWTWDPDTGKWSEVKK
jgi:hypothetical protein